MAVRTSLIRVNNSLSAILYGIISLSVFLAAQGFAVVAPAWATYAAARAYRSELKLAFQPPPLSPDFLRVAQWHQQRSQPPSHMFFILTIVAGTMTTYFVATKSLKALVYVGLGRLTPGYQLRASGGEVQAQLLTIITSVSLVTNAPPFRKIFVDESARIGTLYTGGGRYLLLGTYSLKYLTIRELQAIVAHECGHHHHGAMLLSRVHHRAVMLFSAIESVWTDTYKTARQVAGSDDFLTTSMSPVEVLRNNLGGMVNVLSIPLLLCVLVYRVFLQFAGVMLQDPEYEFYCDSVAYHYYGGGAFCSALQKMVDLELAERIATRIEKMSGRGYEEIMDEEYRRIRRIDPEKRRQSSTPSGTHPALQARLDRAQKALSHPDRSGPVLSREELKCLLTGTTAGSSRTSSRGNE